MVLPETEGSETTRLVVSESTLKIIPATIQVTRRTRKRRRARTPSTGAYPYMKTRKVVGIRLPAAKLTGSQKAKCIPACTAVTAVTQIEAIKVYVVKRRFKRRSGDAFHTRIAKVTRSAGAAKEAIYAIASTWISHAQTTKLTMTRKNREVREAEVERSTSDALRHLYHRVTELHCSRCLVDCLT